MVDYEPLPSVTSVAEAAEPDAPRRVGRKPRQHLAHHRARRPRGDRGGVRPGRAYRQTPLRHHPRPRAVHGAARRDRHLRSGGRPLHAVCRRELSAPRAQHARQHGVQGAGEPGPRGVPRRRRRLRRQGLAVCRSPAGAVGGAQARTAGEMAMRTFRGDPGRRAWPRQCRHDRAGVRRQRERSSACGCTCWPASAPISRPTGSC